jgi:hypothetical protein
MQPRELLAESAVHILEPDGVAITPTDDEQGDAVELDVIWIAFGIRLQLGSRTGRLTVYGDRDYGNWPEDNLSLMEIEFAELGRAAWKNNVARSIGAGSVHAVLEPEQTGHRQPTAVCF